MKVVFDTNVVLDAICRRQDFDKARALVMAVANDEMEGIVTANSVTDIYYISRKAVGNENARNAVWDLMTIFEIASVDGEDCSTALSLPISDFEDAVLAVCAAREEADFIVSRDKEFQNADSPVPVKNLDEMLELLERE